MRQRYHKEKNTTIVVWLLRKPMKRKKKENLEKKKIKNNVFEKAIKSK